MSMRHSHRRRGWLSRNRWGLGLMPLALVAALAASSERVKTYFWDDDLHEPVYAAQGEWVDYTETYVDYSDKGSGTRTVRIKLDSIRELSPKEAAGPLSYQMPAGATGVEVNLSFEADPSMPLSDCRLWLRDRAGNRYQYYVTEIAGYQPIMPCVPSETPGPDIDLGDMSREPDPDEKPRPAKYSVKPVLLVPDGTEFVGVDVSWQQPMYIAFR